MEYSTSSPVNGQRNTTFHWADYLILVIVLLLSGFIGIYHGFKQRRTNNVDQFLAAGRKMHFIPVGISMFVSWMSAIAFIGDPVEVYRFGSVYLYIALGYMLALPPVAHLFIPTYFKTQLVSIRQFMEKYYGPYISLCAVLVQSVGQLMYMGVALYAPSISLSQMGGIDVNICIIVLGVICIIYTSAGGMKAVLWADTAQAGIMLAGLIACTIEGARSVGGITRVMELANQGGRINFNKFNPDPLARATFWTYSIGGFFRVLNPYVADQQWFQRYVTVERERHVKYALYLNIPLYFIFVSLFALAGLVMYAYFHGCDPLVTGRIQTTDQMMPLMVMETMGKYPGVAGLYFATLCSAALSTLSSCQSALSAIGVKDVVTPLYNKITGKTLAGGRAKIATMALSVCFGVINIGLGFLILQLEGTAILPLTMKVTGALGAPLAGIVIIAVLFPFVKTTCTMIGLVISISISLWMALGSMLNPPVPYPGELLPVYTDLCHTTGYNFTTTYTTQQTTTLDDTTTDSLETGFKVNDLYKMAPALFSTLGVFLTVLFALLLHGAVVLMKKIGIMAPSDTHEEKSSNKQKQSLEYLPGTTKL